MIPNARERLLAFSVNRSVQYQPSLRRYLIFKRPLLQEAFIVTGRHLVPLPRRPGRHQQLRRVLLCQRSARFHLKSSKVKRQPVSPYFPGHARRRWSLLAADWLKLEVGGSSKCQQVVSAVTWLLLKDGESPVFHVRRQKSNY